MSDFGKMVRKLRKDAGMSLNDVAGKIGAHKGYVSGIENGKVNPPSVRFIKLFAKLFRADAEEMMLVAHVDKAPPQIREILRELVFGNRTPRQ